MQTYFNHFLPTPNRLRVCNLVYFFVDFLIDLADNLTQLQTEEKQISTKTNKKTMNQNKNKTIMKVFSLSVRKLKKYIITPLSPACS